LLAARVELASRIAFDAVLCVLVAHFDSSS
jgi:hypothetical protein